MLDLHRLRLLRELQRRGAITAVAQALSFSPPAVSQQLANLERGTGVRLLEPVGRRVRRTPQAELPVTHTNVLLSEVSVGSARGARSALRLLQTDRCGRLFFAMRRGTAERPSIRAFAQALRA